MTTASATINEVLDGIRTTSTPKDNTKHKKVDKNKHVLSPYSWTTEDQENNMSNGGQAGEDNSFNPKLSPNEEKKKTLAINRIWTLMEQITPIVLENSAKIDKLMAAARHQEIILMEAFKKIEKIENDIENQKRDFKDGFDTSMKANTTNSLITPMCRFCLRTNHTSETCRTFPSGYARMHCLTELGKCIRCYEDKDHEVCPKEGYKCSVCGEIKGKRDTDHHEDCCDVKFPYRETIKVGNRGDKPQIGKYTAPNAMYPVQSTNRRLPTMHQPSSARFPSKRSRTN